MITNALLSVSDKTGLAPFAKRLVAAGVSLISTGGTAAALRETGLAVKEVSQITGFPEILGGRVKTLHPAIHGGILARPGRAEDDEALERHKLDPIGLIVANLYPFEKTVAKGAEASDVIEQIDIGGVALLRAAAKNHAHVAIVCDPADYDGVILEIEEHGAVTEKTRKRLAAKAFQRTAAYDMAIATWMTAHAVGASAPDPEAPPAVWTTALPLKQSLRYGENPHQRAAFYHDPSVTETSLARARQLHGKELSYNNIADAEGALEAVRDFTDLAPAACVIVKHGTPCGVAIGETSAQAYARAHETDPDSAFGGIIASSAAIDAETAESITTSFYEVIIAPSFTEDARAILTKKKNLRLLETGPFTPKERTLLSRSVVGGLLVMDRDIGTVSLDDLKLVTSLTPTEDILRGLLFAWRCVKWVKSNAIVYTTKNATVGVGAGQMSRVDAAKFGGQKARRSLQGCFMASDAFFPFADNIEAAAQLGIRAIIQPGGSVRDQEVIDACEKHGITMVFTGMRHFRH